MKRAAITEGLRLIFQGIAHLKEAFPHRAFTIDGRLVGDVGEVIAALEYDVVLDAVSQPGHDAKTSDGRNVQIKATFKDSLTFRTVPAYYLGFKLYPDGRHEEISTAPAGSSLTATSEERTWALSCSHFPSRNCAGFPHT
jgi:hypothetical protein